MGMQSYVQKMHYDHVFLTDYTLFKFQYVLHACLAMQVFDSKVAGCHMASYP